MNKIFAGPVLEGVSLYVQTVNLFFHIWDVLGILDFPWNAQGEYEMAFSQGHSI